MSGALLAATSQREALHGRIAALISRLSDGGRDDRARDALLCDALAYQRQHVAPYARLCAHRGVATTAPLSAFPALPTDVFRFARVAAHGPERDARVFRTSGTTSGARGTHHLADLSLYDLAARAAARYALFPDRRPLRLVIVAAHDDAVRESSLSYMLTRFLDWFGADDQRAEDASACVFRAGSLDLAALCAQLEQACAAGQPVALLGTSFGLVHAEDALGERRFQLPAGSRVMQTGGFKGKSRSLSPETMLSLLCARYGVPERHVVQEYGMTELCSQLYEVCLRGALLGEEPPATDARSFWVPGWVRASAVDPDSLAPLPAGEVGLLRIDDLANLDSVCAVQTADLAQVDAAGRVHLLGRAPGATPRGCSLAIEEALADSAGIEQGGLG